MKIAKILDTTGGHCHARRTITWFLFGKYKREQGARFAVARLYDGGLGIIELK